MSFENTDPRKVLATIIKDELELDDQHVLLKNQKWKIPNDPGLYVVLGYISGKPVGNNNYGEPILGGMNEVQEVTINALVQIDAMGFKDELIAPRLPEILAALASVRAKQLMGEKFMSIGRIPPAGFLNVSHLEETAMLNRYTITVAMTYLYRKVKSVEYYDQFPDPEVHTNG